ncbi:riboflavin synthase domain-like protein [Colletotrichum eremochloae]|nr:riboflavin synthase domain-like protein [Colletotrichum eremochloae]
MTTLLETATYTDYGLLLAIALGTTFVYNKGSLLPTTNLNERLLFEKPQKKDVTARASLLTRDIGRRVRESEASFVIFWGSQSGTAENLAHRLGRDIHQQFKSKVIVGDLSDYDPSTLPNVPEHVILILVMSTYGEGDPSDNAQDFVSFYTSKNSSILSHLQFAAFGCGNSSYQYYNKVIHDTASALQRCGARAILPVGKGDEATRTTYEDFHEWKDSFFSCLVSQCNLSKHDAEYQPTVQITCLSPSDEVARDESRSKHKKGIAYLPVTMSRPIARYHDPARSCVFITLDLARHPQLKYRTGDHLAVWPCNPEDEVDRLLRVLGKQSQRNARYRIESIDELVDLTVPANTTLHELVSRHLDICAQVPRETVVDLAQMASKLEVKRELERISRSKETYTAFLEGNYMTLARLMDYTLALHPDAAWDSLPLSFVIDHIPPMQPRLYSIASSSIVEPRQVSLVVSVKPQAVPRCPDTLIHGVASTYLRDAQRSCSRAYLIQAEIRRSSFKLPFNPQTPVVMVAAGTGIAPFRAFVHERARLASVGRAVGPMLLFFGCQSQSDCLFLDEFSGLASRHASQFELRIHTAFSQPVACDSEPQRQKAYVQAKLFEHRQVVIKSLLEEDASLYVCGSTTMAKGVREVLLQTAMSVRQWSRSEAEQWRQERKKSSRWHEDVWS